MLHHSFIFLEGIGLKKEQQLYNQGITTWRDFLATPFIKGISPTRKQNHDLALHQAYHHLRTTNSSYFGRVKPAEVWRLYSTFKDNCVFLDIETTGLDHHTDDLIMVGLFDGIDTKTLICGVNFDPTILKQELEKYSLLVTFNGKQFDIPFLEKHFPGIIPAIPHLDLRFVCARAGYTGGLKHIEKSLNIRRENPAIAQLAGGDVYLLWRRFWATGDKEYLQLLVDYNTEDIVNLKFIADALIPRLEQQLLKDRCS